MEALDILYEALAADIGILVSTSDAEKAKQRLYSARRSAEDPALAGLQIRMSPFSETDLFIIKKDLKGNSKDLGRAKENGATN